MRVLFVCRGNTCRSPMAAKLLERELSKVSLLATTSVESAGTHASHTPRGADPRAIVTIGHRGLDLAGHASRAVADLDLVAFDQIVALDHATLAWLKAHVPQETRGRLKLMMDYAPLMGASEVPDPFHGTQADYEHALDLIEEAVHGFVLTLQGAAR
jgi:protein-tyrosine phosphatase